MIKLSIIIPVYNAQKFLQSTIESLIIEKSREIEFIFVNDGSKDKSIDILNKYKLRDNRIKVINKHNTGVSDTRNVGIKNALGQYIMFCDSDDLFEANYYEIFNHLVSSDTNTDYFIIHNAYDNTDISSDDIINGIYNLDYKYSNLCLRTVWSKIYKKDFLEKCKILFDTDCSDGEDLLFNTSIVLNNAKIKFVKEHIYNYRIVLKSLSRNLNLDSYDILRNKVVKYCKTIDNLAYLLERLDILYLIANVWNICRNNIRDYEKKIDIYMKKENMTIALSNSNNHEILGLKKVLLVLIKHKCFKIIKFCSLIINKYDKFKYDKSNRFIKI